MADFLDEKRKEIQDRLKELKPAVDEYQLLLGGRSGTRWTSATGRPSRPRRPRAAPAAAA